MSRPIYAVVDIETTGTDPMKDRIIQLGCVLIQDGKIVNRFATDVNPGRGISKQIQNLTGISNSRVHKAPYFEDVADTIFNLLQGTIFVAHNIYFDYKFLNSELRRCGLPKLGIPGIDTVELAQIFLPTEASFRLGDLAERFGLIHENPHQADSDAEVTGALFLYIEKIMRQLPVATMELIAGISDQTGMQTGDFIRQVANELAERPRDLPEDLQLVEGIPLRKLPTVLYSEPHYAQHYPKKKKGKEKLFGDHLAFRKEQARLMNLVYDHFTESEDKNLMIEAATGMGKSIGYLLPASFLASPEQPVIVSTVSLVLQDQLLTKDIPLLNHVLEQPIQATVIKSQRHYLDLQRFSDSLKLPDNQKQYCLYQMAVLVWLTETVTGDLDELNIINLNHQFFQDVRHRGIKGLNKESAFYSVDYYRYLKQRIKQSNLLIVNHALLAQENLREQPLLPASPYLIIDEAHHLPEICERVTNRGVNFRFFERRIQQVTGEGGLLEQLQGVVAEDAEVTHLLELYQEELEALRDSQQEFSRYYQSLKLKDEHLVTASELAVLPLKPAKAMDRMQLYFQEVTQLQEQLTQLIQRQQQKWLPQERNEFDQLLNLFDEIAEQGAIMAAWFTNWDSRYAHWLVPNEKQDSLTCRLLDYEAALLPETSWYDRYEKILYIGGTLKIGSDRHYFANRLGIPDTKLKIIQAPFDYQQQTKVLLPDRGITIQDMTPNEYALYIKDILVAILKDNQRPALVLFTSHDTLQRVYEKMHLPFLERGREILAQGFGGGREKLLKRFRSGGDSILFGTDSFWEGIDIPGDALQIVIVTRLPFDNPKRPTVIARNDYLEAQGINPFYQESVPRAALKLRQAYGRLIRSDTDRGVLVILDRRILTTKYGRRLKGAFPKNVAFEELKVAKIRRTIDEFLDKDTETCHDGPENLV